MSENLILKFKHFETQAAFDENFNSNKISNADLCFIKESSKIYTHGHFYDCSGYNNDILDVEVFIPISRDFSDDFNNDFAR